MRYLFTFSSYYGIRQYLLQASGIFENLQLHLAQYGHLQPQGSVSQ